MTEKFESKFHRWYVGGQGEIEEKTHIALESSPIVRGITYEQVLREYRKYVNDPSAELPESVLQAFLLEKPRTENDRKT